MWNQTSIADIEQISEPMSAPKTPKIFVANVETIDKKQQKVNAIAFALGIAFLCVLFLLTTNGFIRLSGPFLPMFLMLFHQRLEYVLRYQALGLAPIAINALLLFGRQFQKNSASDPWSDRLEKTLMDSTQQFLMSTIIQMVLTANLNAQQIMLFPPFMAVTCFIGQVVYCLGFPKYHYFGLSVSFVPTLIAVLFNAYGAINFLFA